MKIPVTVKIRTGWDESSRNAAEVAHIAFNEGLTWVAIHGRTRAAGYSGESDWDFIAETKAKSHIPILGNGDIASGEMAVRRLRESGCDGVLIGRGCLKNPWIFRQAMGLWLEGQEPHLDRDFAYIFDRLHQAFVRTTTDRTDGLPKDRITMLQMKKFASWYSTGYPGASQFRKQIFQHETLEATLGAVSDYFKGIAALVQADTSREAFLMGGHG